MTAAAVLAVESVTGGVVFLGCVITGAWLAHAGVLTIKRPPKPRQPRQQAEAAREGDR